MENCIVSLPISGRDYFQLYTVFLTPENIPGLIHLHQNQLLSFLKVFTYYYDLIAEKAILIVSIMENSP